MLRNDEKLSEQQVLLSQFVEVNAVLPGGGVPRPLKSADPSRHMSTFKCGLRRFDGHGTSSYRPTNTAATKEMESAFTKMMRERELQDSGCFGRQTQNAQAVEPVKQVQLTQISKQGLKEEQEQQPMGECYSLSDSASKKTE
jgi:hypothetical protein